MQIIRDAKVVTRDYIVPGSRLARAYVVDL